MAARFDGSTDVLSRTATGLGGGAVTMCCWVYIDTDRNTYSYVIGADNASQYHLLGFVADGTTLEFSTDGGFVSSSTSFSTAGWYFIASVYDPAVSDVVYWRTLAAASLSSASGTVTGSVAT